MPSSAAQRPGGNPVNCYDQSVLGRKKAVSQVDSSCHCSCMALSKNSPAPQQARLQAVHINQLHPEWSLRRIASHIGRTHGFVRKWIKIYQLQGAVVDQPRSGRPYKLTAAAAQHALTAAQLKECKTLLLLQPKFSSKQR